MSNQNPKTTAPVTRRAMSINEFCRDYSMSRTAAYDLIRAGKLPSVMVGAKRIIRVDDAEAWLASLPYGPLEGA